VRQQVTHAASSSTSWPAQQRSVAAAAATSDTPAAAAARHPEGRGFKELYLHDNVHPGAFAGPIAVANIPGEMPLPSTAAGCSSCISQAAPTITTYRQRTHLDDMPTLRRLQS
jgi:hypothetical protein